MSKDHNAATDLQHWDNKLHALIESYARGYEAGIKEGKKQ